MPEIEAKFEVDPDQIELRTKTNGDLIRIDGVHLGPENAANLAGLINSGAILEIEIKAAKSGQ
jgi:hypothetical protein